MRKKILTLLLLIILPLIWNLVDANSNSTKYTYFYGQGCSHCIKVENYFATTNIDEENSVEKYEIRFDQKGRSVLEEKLKHLPLSLEEIGTPFLVIQKWDNYSSLMWDTPIINYFKALASEKKPDIASWTTVEQDHKPTNTDQTAGNKKDQDKPSSSWTRIWEENENVTEATGTYLTGTSDQKLAEQPAKFIPLLLSGALSDSINPCAFAVMLLLLTTILSKSKSKKKTIFAGLLFCLAIFSSYFLMWLGFLKLIIQETLQYTLVFKWVIGIFWILIGLANLKDFFWYGKWFIMEIPLAWRPRMMKIIQAVVSPLWAFVVGIIVSLFLLPCSAGPYVTVLMLLGAESSELNHLGVFYLLLYNLIFILPMLVITFMVGTGYTSAEAIGKFKNKHTKLIHLIVGLLMLALGIYIIGSMYL